MANGIDSEERLTIKVDEQRISNEDNSKLKLNNSIVTDILPDCLELNSDIGIYLDGKKLDPDDYEYIPSSTLTAKRDAKEFYPDKNVFSYEYVSDDPDKCGQLKINLGDINETHEIKFTTDIKTELYEKTFWSYVVNEVWLATDGDNDGNFKGVYKYRSNPVYMTMSPIYKMALESFSHFVEKDNILHEVSSDYDPQNHTIAWQIAINSDGIPMDGAIITDKLPEELKFTDYIAVTNFLPYDDKSNPNASLWSHRFLVNNDGSLRYFWMNSDYYGSGKPGGLWKESENEFSFDYDEESNTIRFKINKSFNSQYVICFDTKIADPNIYASNGDVKLQNKATIKIGGSGNEASSDLWTTNGGKTQSEMINLSAVDYNCLDHIVKWSAIVNRNKLSLKKGNIFDEIDKNQKYVDGSFKIEKYNIDSGNGSGEVVYDDSIKDSNGQLIHGDKFIHSPATETQKESLNYYMGDETTDETYLVTFETEITDPSIFKSNVEKPVYNEITLKNAIDSKAYDGDLALPEVSDRSEINVKSSVVEKEGVFHPETNTIDWSIAANINMLHLDKAIIEDKFQKGLDLDVDSIKIYPLSINADGSFNVSKDAISREKYKIEDYNPEENEDDGNYISDQRILNVEFLGAIEDAYMLRFTTEADLNYAPFYNTAYFKGTDAAGNNNSDSSNQVKIPGTIGNVGAEVQKEEGSIITFAVDSDADQQEPLKGAKYEIYYGGDGENYNSDEELLKDAGKVDETGRIKFKQLNYGWYKIVETKAPDGYKPINSSNGNIKYLRISSQGSIEAIFKHTKIPEDTDGKIKILKVDEYGNPLEGAKFVLKDSEGLEQDIKTSQDDGQLVFDVPFGIYTIEEIQAPQGYKLGIDDKNLENIVINSNRKIVELVVKNYQITEPPIEGSINIIKVAEEDKNKRLQGAEFCLYSTGDYDNVLDTKMSDSNGVVYFDNLPEGVYDIKEITPPEGYKISKAIYKGVVISSDSNKDVSIEITNKQNESISDNPVDGGIQEDNFGESSNTSNKTEDKDGEDVKDEEYGWLNDIIKNNSVIKSIIDGEDVGFKQEIQRKLKENGKHDANTLMEILGVDEKGEKISEEKGESVIPQAGRMIDTKVMILLGVIMIVLGIHMNNKKI